MAPPSASVGVPEPEVPAVPFPAVDSGGWDTSGFDIDAGGIPTLQQFNYDSEGRRDPFEPYRELELEIKRNEAEDIVVKDIGPVFPLARWSVDEIKLIATRLSSSGYRAMFLAPNNQRFTLGKGERIGNNNGYVEAIREEEVIITEPVVIKGEPHLVTRVMRLRD